MWMAKGNTRAERKPSFSDYIGNSSNCSTTICVCVCVVHEQSHELGEIKDSVTAVYALRTHSRLAVVQWRYLCEVVTHPVAVMVASVLSA